MRAEEIEMHASVTLRKQAMIRDDLLSVRRQQRRKKDNSGDGKDEKDCRDGEDNCQGERGGLRESIK